MNPSKTIALRPGGQGPLPPNRAQGGGGAGGTSFVPGRGQGFGGGQPRGPHPLAAPMYWACGDVLALASSLALGAPPPPSARDMRRKLDELFFAMQERARSANIPPEDVGDAAYALMALLDEILVQMDWPGRGEWQTSPLQFVHFRENTAGDGFFFRADGLLRQPHRAHVMLVYFLCLGMGFQGRYAVHGGAGLAPIYEALGAAASQHLPPSDILSPHGEPPDLGDTLLKREAPLVRVAIAIMGVAVIAFFVMRSVLWFEVGGVSRATSQGPPSTPASGPSSSP